MSVAQLAAGELDLTIRVPPAEGPGPRERRRASSSSTCRAWASSTSTSTTPTRTRPSARRSPTRSTGRRSSRRCSVAWRPSTTRSRPGSRSTTTSTSTSSTWTRPRSSWPRRSWDMSKTFRLALLAEDPNFTVTAPALQQYLQALGLKVELTALPTAPYTDLIQKTDDFEAFLSFGGSEGVGWYQSSIYFDCAGLGTSQLKLPADPVHLHRPVRGRGRGHRRRAGRDPAQAGPRPQREPAGDLPLAAQLPARLFGQAGWRLRHLSQRA